MPLLLIRFIFVLALCTGLDAAPGIDLHPTRRAENFIVHDLRGIEITPSFSGRTDGEERISIGPNVLAISAERVKRAVFSVLRLSTWGGATIHLVLKKRGKVREPIRIEPILFGDGWVYRVEIADSIEKDELLRGLVEVVLMELANRSKGPKSAEIPRWLKDGLSLHLANSVGRELVISSVEAGSMLRSLRNLMGADTLVQTRRILILGAHPSISDLSHPSQEQLGTGNIRKYRAAAQLLVSELLRLPDGEKQLIGMIRELPNFWNWEAAFLRGFNTRFRSMLDLEKWWAVTLVSFTGRDPSQVWPPAICLQQLDEILLATVQLRWSTSALPVRRHATLQQILSEWDFGVQRPALWQTIRRLTALRPYCPPGFNLHLASVASPNQLQAFGRSLVTISSMNGQLHFRIFDSNGEKVVDVNETGIPIERGQELIQLKEQLVRLPMGYRFSELKRREIIDRVASMVGYTVPPEILPLIDGYRASLRTYLERRASLSAAPVTKLRAAPLPEVLIEKTVRELDQLYRWRESLWRDYVPNRLTGSNG